MASKLFPARDWIILELDEQKDKVGHLYIPDTAKDAPQVGTVVAVGPGEPARPDDAFNHFDMMTKVGDRVLFTKYSGADVEWEGRSLLMVRESEIICYVKEEK